MLIHRRFALFAIFTLTIAHLGDAQRVSAKPSQPPPSPQKKYTEYIVRFLPHLSFAEESAIIEHYGAKIEHTFRFNGAHVIQFAPVQTTEEISVAVNAIAATEAIRYIEPNRPLRISTPQWTSLDEISSIRPNDPRFGDQYALHNLGTAAESIPDADIDAPEAWALSTGSRDVVVAVIDTGIDWKHPDLIDNMWTNPGESGRDAQGRDKRKNGVDDDNNGYVDDWRGWDFINNDNDPMDDNGHGTHCAGIIGATGNNARGVAGINWQVSLVGLKFISKEGSGDTDHAVQAVEYAANMGIPITNNSYGGEESNQIFTEVIQYAAERGVLFVAAAGNSSSENDRTPHYPSGYDNNNIVSVAATGAEDTMTYFSCFGLRSVDIAAPGDNILSTWPEQQYEALSGTSMAAPYVAGVAALVLSRYPSLNTTHLKDRILRTADPLLGLQGLIATGARLNAYNALEDDQIPPGRVRNLEITEASPAELKLRWLPSGDDDYEGQARSYILHFSATNANSNTDFIPASTATLVDIHNDGQWMSARATGFPFAFSGNIYMLAIDNAGLVSNPSIVLPAALAQTVTTLSITPNQEPPHPALNLEPPWRTLEYTFATNAPNEQYSNNTTANLTLRDVHLTPDTVIVLRTAFDLELDYDFAVVEVSINQGQTWNPLSELTGTRPWHDLLIPVATTITSETRGIIRLRLTTDAAIAGAGWQIETIRLVRPRAH